jgi:ribonuclease P protein component
MLPAERRLVEKKDFSKIQRIGQRFFTDFLQLQFVKNGQSKTMIGFVVGVRFSKKAVERNALKRKLRAICKQEMENIKEGMEIVILAKNNPGAEKSSAQLKEIVDELLKKSNLLKRLPK